MRIYPVVIANNIKWYNGKDKRFRTGNEGADTGKCNN
jgi:hypothetical protein